MNITFYPDSKLSAEAVEHKSFFWLDLIENGVEVLTIFGGGRGLTLDQLQRIAAIINEPKQPLTLEEQQHLMAALRNSSELVPEPEPKPPSELLDDSIPF